MPVRNPGAGSSTSSGNGSVTRVVPTGTTVTVATTYSLVVADYYYVQGTGSLVLEGDAVLEVL